MQKTVEQLGKLFGSTAQVKCMRLLLQYPDRAFSLIEVQEKAKVSRSELRAAVHSLKSVGFLYNHQVAVRKKLKSGKIQTRKVDGIELKKTYPMIPHLYTLLIGCGLIEPEEIYALFSGVGKIHLLALSGYFIDDSDRGALDLLIVGDKVHTRKLERAVRTLESEIGRGVRYAHFTLPEYTYRLTMYDKLIRDVFDYPHVKVIDKIKK